MNVRYCGRTSDGTLVGVRGSCNHGSTDGASVGASDGASVGTLKGMYGKQ